MSIDERVHRDLDVDTLTALHRHVGEAMAVKAPEFGSHAWTQLPDGDPAKTAATVQAAVSWFSSMAFGVGVPTEAVERELADRLNAASKSVAGAWRPRRGAAWAT